MKTLHNLGRPSTGSISCYAVVVKQYNNKNYCYYDYSIKRRHKYALSPRRSMQFGGKMNVAAAMKDIKTQGTRMFIT